MHGLQRTDTKAKSTKIRCSSAHWKGNFLNFPKLTLLLSVGHLQGVLWAFKHKSHFFLGHPVFCLEIYGKHISDYQRTHVVAAGAARQVLHCCLLHVPDDGRARDKGHLGPPAPHRAPRTPGHPRPCHQVQKYLITQIFTHLKLFLGLEEMRNCPHYWRHSEIVCPLC